MPSCSVAGCRNRSGSSSSTNTNSPSYSKLISEHRFPRDPDLRRRWADFCGRGAGFAPSKSAIVCSAHFDGDADFERDLRGELLGVKTNRKLRPGAVPSIGVESTEEMPEVAVAATVEGAERAPLSPIVIRNGGVMEKVAGKSDESLTAKLDLKAVDDPKMLKDGEIVNGQNEDGSPKLNGGCDAISKNKGESNGIVKKPSGAGAKSEVEGGEATSPGKAGDAKSKANKAAGENGVAVVNGDHGAGEAASEECDVASGTSDNSEPPTPAVPKAQAVVKSDLAKVRPKQDSWKIPLSPSNSNNLLEPEVSIEVVSYGRQRQLHNDTPGMEVDGGNEEEEDDEDPPALVVDEGDAAEKVVKGKKGGGTSPARSTEQEVRKSSPTPDIKIVQIRSEAAGTKRPMSPPAVSVTKKLRASPLRGGAAAAVEQEPPKTTAVAVTGPPDRLPDVKDMETLDKMIMSVKKDIRAMDTQVKEKEREWNLLIHKKKKMEEYYLKLKRKRDVEVLETTGVLPPPPAASGANNKVAVAAAAPVAGNKTIIVSAGIQEKPTEAGPTYKFSLVTPGMSGSKLHVKSQEPVPLTPRAMTITADMLYGGGKGKAGSNQTVQLTQAAAQTPRVSVASANPTVAPPNVHNRRWKMPNVPVSVNSPSKPQTASSAQAQELLRHQQQQQKQQQQQQGMSFQQQQQQQKQHQQQSDKLQQALTRGNFQAATTQLQQAFGANVSNAAEAAAAAVVQAAAANAAAAGVNQRQRNVNLGGGGGIRIPVSSHQQQSMATTSLETILEAAKAAQNSSLRAGKGGGVTVTPMNNEKSKNKEPPKAESHPSCHGCKKKMAQFVCAGCNSQWYCSRECQISDWDEHAEQCSA